HYVPSMMQESMIASLISANLGEAAETAIQSVLFDFDTSPSEVPIDALRADIERLMTGHETLGQLVLALDQDESDFAQETLAKLARMSPTSLSLAFEQIKRGGQMNFRENMAMELRIVSRIMAAPDFFEGVRALLIDRDKKPIWSPAELSDVSAADIEAYFEPIDGDELTFDEGLLS
ncbi:MAG: enoyl-CoA hydratase/isomerase family protein, partial [Parvularculaceae bacterium]